MSIPMNTLPAEFEENHGSVDLGDDEKPGQDYDGEDEDFDISRLQQRVWLVKVPKFLMEKWSETQEAGMPLGRVRVYDEKDANGDPKIAVILDEQPEDIKGKGPAGASTSRAVPTEYKLTLQNTATKNMYVFGEKEEEDLDSGEVGHRKRRRITSALGTVHHECSLTPSLSSLNASSSYRNIMRDRQRKAAEPKRTIKMLDVDQGVANRLAAGQGLPGIKGRVTNFVKTKVSASASGTLRSARLPRNELLDLLFGHFEDKPYWQLKALGEHVEQPQVYLKEVLADIAQLVPRGPYAGMWKLKDEYKTKAVDSGAKVEPGTASTSGSGAAVPRSTTPQGEDVKPKAIELEDDEDDEDMEEVK